MRGAGLALFLSVALALDGLTHFYLWNRLVAPLFALGSPPRLAATWALVALALVLPLGAIGSRVLAGHGSAFAWPAFAWMGLLFLLLVLLGAADALRGVLLAGARLAAFGASNDTAQGISAWLAASYWRVASPAALVVALAAGSIGMAAVRGTPAVKRVTIELPALPRGLEGFTIVQLTDLHLGEILGDAWLRGVVARVNELKPDLVAITGDLVDGSVQQLGPIVANLAALNARLGVFFVIGNHEYYSGVEEWTTELRRLGIRVLRNERVTVGEGDGRLEVAGVDDPSGARFGYAGGADVERALSGYNRERPLVLLSHQPRTIDEAALHGASLQLSGHTHGGQIWPFGYIVALTQPYLHGWAKHGGAQIYVSNGTGYWGPPMRLATPAEITFITLRPAAP